MSNPTETFRGALHATGINYAGDIIADGKLHRFKAAGDNNRNSWYVLHAGPPAAGAFYCWKRDIKGKWYDQKQQVSQSGWEQIRRHWQEAEREREQVEMERHAKARKTAAWILERAKPVTMHGYLTAKGVQPHGGVRERRGSLVLPLRDASDELHSLQFISPSGDKHFLSGGRVVGCFFAVAETPDSPLVIAEGFATAASIAEATGLATVAAMNAGNLPTVAKALREKFPEREIIIAADNDQFTDGNPGLAKARDAAFAIRAKLAVPAFKNVTTKPTDFNDLHKLEGLDFVKTQIESAATPTETDEQRFQRLAKLTPAEYDRVRDDETRQAGVRGGTLDSEVAKRRPKSVETLQGGALNMVDVELWPEAVVGADVLAEIAEVYSRYIVLPASAADFLALWNAHTHCFELFQCSPRLNISSPDKGCGKTTLRDLIGTMVPRPLPTENLSVAVLFRVIEKYKPTLLADEADSWVHESEELRGLLNAGHRRGGQALRCEGEGNEVRAFNVFAPAILCGIGALPGTLHDRSIVIRLKRAKPGELRERFDSRRIERETVLRRKLARWCEDNRARLEGCDPELPSGAFNRLADNWRPLFAIAEIAGGDWPQRAATAFAKMISQNDADAQGTRTMLLADIRQVFGETAVERILSKTLVEKLCTMSDRPWPEAHKGHPVTQTWLARQLRNFGIATRALTVGDERAKGYTLADFADIFERYLPVEGETKRDSVTMPENIGDSQFPKRDREQGCHASETHKTSENNEPSRCHASNPPALDPEPIEALLL